MPFPAGYGAIRFAALFTRAARAYIAGMNDPLHMMKLCVGADRPEDLEEWQQQRFGARVVSATLMLYGSVQVVVFAAFMILRSASLKIAPPSYVSVRTPLSNNPALFSSSVPRL